LDLNLDKEWIRSLLTAFRQDQQDLKDFLIFHFPDGNKKNSMRQRRIKLFLNDKIVGSRIYSLIIKLIIYPGASFSPKAMGFGRFHLENDQKKSCLSCKSCLKFF
jgi:hypothetical protein